MENEQRTLNVLIDGAVIDAAKSAAERNGMLLRKWVERSLREAAKSEEIKLQEPARGLRYEPVD